MDIKQAYAWAKRFAISSIKSVTDVACLEIRQLKALATKFNAELGLVITKARFGKVYSNMKKKELIDALWFVRLEQLSKPLTQVWEFMEMSKRVFAYFADGEAWCIYVGFTEEAKALIFHRDIQVAQKCRLASMRKADRLKRHGFNYEVKLWGLDADVLDKMLAKDKSTLTNTSASQSTSTPSSAALKESTSTHKAPPLQLPVNSNRMIVVKDDCGWEGNTGVIEKVDGDAVWCRMDGNENAPLMRFKASQIKRDEEISIQTMQRMYDNLVGKRAETAMLQFIRNRGCDVVDGEVVVREVAVSA